MKSIFTIESLDGGCQARSGTIETEHGAVPTPAFLPVGTLATVKALSPAELRSARARMILGNTYHLVQQPGVDVIAAAGGLAEFMRWDGPSLTDSGGFQVFSLQDTRKLNEEGVSFKSIYNGETLLFTPESALDWQRKIGADIILALDVFPGYPAERGEIKLSVERTNRWGKRFIDAWRSSEGECNWRQAAFLVVQGGVDGGFRRRSVEGLAALEPDGFGIGGLSVGEPRDEMIDAAALCCDLLPDEKPRHLMGVGKPEDLLAAIQVGVDMFDCVLPTRNGRNGQAFTSSGAVNIRNAGYRTDNQPLDRKCDCYCCRTFTKAYLHHLAVAGELLGLRLLSLHNIYYYQRLMEGARRAIASGRFTKWKASVIEDSGRVGE